MCGKFCPARSKFMNLKKYHYNLIFHAQMKFCYVQSWICQEDSFLAAFKSPPAICGETEIHYAPSHIFTNSISLLELLIESRTIIGRLLSSSIKFLPPGKSKYATHSYRHVIAVAGKIWNGCNKEQTKILLPLSENRKKNGKQELFIKFSMYLYHGVQTFSLSYHWGIH